MARILTGIQSTGVPHLGNILGAILPGLELSRQPGNETFFFIADLHSLTQIKDPVLLKHNTYSVASAWLAFGFDYQTQTLFRQSDVAEVCELAWYLSCFTPYPMLANAHSFKDKSDRVHEVNAGLFIYPVLMAADILLYDSDIVPVGQDQKQHLEITRDIAITINNQYGKVFVVPEMRIKEETKNIPGIDGKKMSKSYNNYIDIFQEEKVLKKQIFSIITDSKSKEDVKNPESCNAFAIYSLLANEKDIDDMNRKYKAGNYGYGEIKKNILELILDKYSKERLNYRQYMNDLTELEKKLGIGKEKAVLIAQKVLKRVREVIGY